ncbi:MAG: hypothetical protein IK064_00260 [Clostridia bacterium]|nr:hypothetical protein [Clostridia bacterium]
MLYDLIKPHSSVSTIGMCKNAGKTTVLNSMIADCFLRGECLGLTSVGRDGERSDVVTGTKKPEICIYGGTVVATAEGALPLGDVSREILETTGMPTPMGEVVIFRAHSDGLVQLAGPSMTAQLRILRQKLPEFGADRVIIDGALSRKSLAMPAVSSGTILCTGASYSRDMEKTVRDTAHAAALMSLPKTERSVPAETNGKFIVIKANGARGFENAADAADAIRTDGANALFIRGGVTDAHTEALFAAGRKLDSLEIVCEDGSRLLFSVKNYEKLLRAGARFTAQERTSLIAVTVNPFSAYGNHYDKNAFYDAMRRAIPPEVPVMDVKREMGITDA